MVLYKFRRWNIVLCKECGLVKTARKKFVDYKNYHRDQEYHNEDMLFRNIFLKRFQLISKYKKPGKVLDIGASTGTMLDLFKENGWETWGVEPSESHKIASSRGHNIIHGVFEKAPLKKNYFDVVILNHTLEHVLDPVLVLKKIETVLKRQGLVYIDVPNFNSLSRKIAGSSWKYLLPDEHVHHFTGDSLTKIVKKAKLEPFFFATWSGIFDVSSPASKLFYELTHLKKSFFTDILEIPGNVIATIFNQGTNLVVIAKKL